MLHGHSYGWHHIFPYCKVQCVQVIGLPRSELTLSRLCKIFMLCGSRIIARKGGILFGGPKVTKLTYPKTSLTYCYTSDKIKKEGIAVCKGVFSGDYNHFQNCWNDSSFRGAALPHFNVVRREGKTRPTFEQTFAAAILNVKSTLNGGKGGCWIFFLNLNVKQGVVRCAFQLLLSLIVSALISLAWGIWGFLSV